MHDDLELLQKRSGLTGEVIYLTGKKKKLLVSPINSIRYEYKLFSCQLIVFLHVGKTKYSHSASRH